MHALVGPIHPPVEAARVCGVLILIGFGYKLAEPGAEVRVPLGIAAGGRRSGGEEGDNEAKNG